jgi:hypothetical protein
MEKPGQIIDSEVGGEKMEKIGRLQIRFLVPCFMKFYLMTQLLKMLLCL